MKKRLKILSIAVLSGILLTTGCSAIPTSGSGNATKMSAGLDWKKTNDPSLKGQEITVLWTNTDGENGPRSQLIKEFTKQTGIKVKELAVDYNSLYNKITTAALSNSSDIDVVEMDTIWAGQFYQGNIVEDLTHIVPKDVQDKFTPSSIGSVTYDGHLLAIPFFSSTKHFYWNKELLQKAGYDHPPKTWSEFREVSKKLKEQGIYASGWSWKQAEGLVCDYVSLVYAFGGKFFENGKPVFNQGGGLKALQFMADLINKDRTVDPASLQWTENDVNSAFSAGKIAMMSNWEGIYPDIDNPKKSKVAGKTDVGLMPGEGSVVSAAVTGSEGIAIMKNSKHKQAALAYLKWIGSKEFQYGHFAKAGYYPSLQSLYQDPEILKADTTKKIGKIKAQFQYGVDRPNAPEYVKWSDALAAELHDALLGKKSPQEALDSAVKQIEQVK